MDVVLSRQVPIWGLDNLSSVPRPIAPLLRLTAVQEERCSAVQCSAVQCSAVQCSAVQCSAVQCSAGGGACIE
jgi:hypothetical protein